MKTAVKKPVATSLIFIGVVLIGILFLYATAIDLYPDIDLNIVTVMTSYSGAGAEDVEENVTRPLEDVLNSTEKLKELYSTSKDGVSLILLEVRFRHRYERRYERCTRQGGPHIGIPARGYGGSHDYEV